MISGTRSRNIGLLSRGQGGEKMNRRQMLKGIAATALVAGFDPLTRRWVRAAEAAACGFTAACAAEETTYNDLRRASEKVRQED
jgi:hypothetical protein